MSTMRLMAYDASGDPLAGLTPTWHIWVNAGTGDSADEPTLEEYDLGEYGVVDPPEDECGIIDFGATASPRYVFISSTTYNVIPAFSLASGTPLEGLTPTWDLYNGATEPTFDELGSGLYRIDDLEVGVTGLIDLGATASPRRIYVGEEHDDGDEEDPTISNLSPADGESIARTDSISFDVTDNRDLGRIIIAVQYARFRGATEIVWDGTEAIGPHTVTVTQLDEGWHFVISRTTGWPAAPTVKVFVADLSGNEV